MDLLQAVLLDVLEVPPAINLQSLHFPTFQARVIPAPASIPQACSYIG